MVRSLILGSSSISSVSNERIWSKHCLRDVFITINSKHRLLLFTSFDGGWVYLTSFLSLSPCFLKKSYCCYNITKLMLSTSGIAFDMFFLLSTQKS